MKKIKDEKSLLKQLTSEIDSCKKENIVFLAGHFPLIYNKKEAIEALDYWGIFSEYSLELACKLAKYAKGIGKKIKFIFFVDDHMYEDMSALTSAQLSIRRNQLYKRRSGKNAQLPKKYKKILTKYGFSEDEVIRQDQGKTGRESCLYFSEKILRASNIKIENPCAREYTEFIENKRYFDKKTSYIIAFIPRRCEENICHFALDLEIKGLSGSHIFIDTMAKLETKESIYSFGKGISYRKD